MTCCACLSRCRVCAEWAELRDSAPAGSIQEELRKSKHVVDLMEMLDEDTDDEDEDGDEEDDEEDEDD